MTCVQNILYTVHQIVSKVKKLSLFSRLRVDEPSRKMLLLQLIASASLIFLNEFFNCLLYFENICAILVKEMLKYISKNAKKVYQWVKNAFHWQI